MSILDDVQSKVKSYFNKWIQVVDFENEVTIEYFPYSEGAKDIKGHCGQCIAVNRCWFVDDNDKKPSKNNMKIVKVPLLPGLYHPGCHCMEFPIIKPSKIDITLIIPMGKLDWLFKDKIGLLNAWGYSENDRDEVLEIIKEKSKEAYISGNYRIRKINRHGANATFYLEMPGKNEKAGRIYKCLSSYMIFPNGKLKSNTLIGGAYENL